jgi:biopolymer transport protein ExbD
MAGGGRRNPLNVNLTPMIDCTMLLVIFFLLTTQMASPDFVSLRLPRPHSSVAREHQAGNKAVINVVPYDDSQIASGAGRDDQAMEYRLGTEHYQVGDLNKLLDRLNFLRSISSDPKEFMVQIRCDTRIGFVEVEPIFQALQQARIQKVHVAAVRAPGG